PLLDDSHPGVLSPVYPPGVSFRLAEPPLQLIVVYRQLFSLLGPYPDEQASGKTAHDFGQVCCEGLALSVVLAVQLPEPGLALPPWPFLLFEGLCHRSDLFDLLADLLLLVFHLRQASINAPCQAGQLTVRWPWLVQVQVPLQRGPHFQQRLRHAQSRW